MSGAATEVESIPNGEKEAIDAIIQDIKMQLNQEYKPGQTMRRGAHAKTIALCDATFQVSEKIPEAFRVGVFKKTHKYNAMVRLSSAASVVQSDTAKDVRGFAIKLLNVPDEKIPEATLDRTSQDFILLSSPTMPLGTVSLFHDFVYYSARNLFPVFVAKMIFKGYAKNLLDLNNARIAPPSMLTIPYFSTTPYEYGPNTIVKYYIEPLVNEQELQTSGSTGAGDDYLTKEAQQRLSAQDVRFEFGVQQRQGTMTVEDAAELWQSPKIPLATLTIPKQAFDIDAQSKKAETLSFAVAHAVKEQRPIGGLNRARMALYEVVAKFRMDHNNK